MIFSGDTEVTCLPADDRGLAYGDGLFETMAFIDGQIHNWREHYLRLQQGCERLTLACPPEQRLLELIQSEFKHVARSSARLNTEWTVKLILTRGAGGRGYRYPDHCDASLLIRFSPWPDIPEHFYTQGIQSTICTTRLAHQPLLAGIKHLNRLEQVFAKNELNHTRFFEGITLDYKDHLIEGTSSNLFFVRDRQLFTPELLNCGVNGTIRRLTILLAKDLQIPVTEGNFTMTDLRLADEMFFTNSLMGICTVNKIMITNEDCLIFSEKLISRQISRIINPALKRPVIT